MRCIITAFIIVTLLVAPASAGLPGEADFASLDSIGRWIANYRTKPTPARMPAAVRAMSQLGVFKEPEGAGVYIGFIAGVLGANPDRAEELVGKMLPIATSDEWVIVRAIAYSGHHDWHRWLRKFTERLPSRKVMIEKYLDGRLPTLDEIRWRRKGRPSGIRHAATLSALPRPMRRARRASTAVRSCSTRYGATISQPALSTRSSA